MIGGIVRAIYSFIINGYPTVNEWGAVPKVWASCQVSDNACILNCKSQVGEDERIMGYSLNSLKGVT